jgi:hypothetical protein
MRTLLAMMLLVTVSVPAIGDDDPPSVSIKLGPREGRVRPVKKGLSHTGGGNIDVAQPSADTMVMTLTGSVVACGSPICHATASLDFDVRQVFEIVCDDKDVKKVKLIIDGRTMGLLRGACLHGIAEASGAVTTLAADVHEQVMLESKPHEAQGPESLSVNDREGPSVYLIPPGRYTLHQTFRVSAFAPLTALPCKPVSAEFADAVLDPLWLAHNESFRAATSKDFGYQITITVAANSE